MMTRDVLLAHDDALDEAIAGLERARDHEAAVARSVQVAHELRKHLAGLMHQIEDLQTDVAALKARSPQLAGGRATHHGPLLYPDRVKFEMDLNATVEHLAVRDWVVITLQVVADAMPLPISVSTLRSRMIGYGLVDDNHSVLRTLRRMAQEYQRRHGLF